jgi:hypothetical protein
VLIAGSFSLAVAEGDDKRQLVKFLRPMIDHTLSNMRDHVQALQESQSQLGMGHADDAAKIAESSCGCRP